MSDALLATALEDAEKSTPAVRAGALMRIARVLTASDRDAARRLFERALDEAQQIAGRDGEALMEDAPLMAAAIAPDLLSSIPATGRKRRLMRIRIDSIASTMLSHGHTNAVYERIMRCDDSGEFPLGVAHALMQQLDSERQLIVLRRVIKEWRKNGDFRFPHLFQSKWNLLPREEARTVVREIVQAALDEPDRYMQGSYDPQGGVQITSHREHTLFQMLHILRALDVPLVAKLIAEHEQLAQMVARFPNGMESVLEAAKARREAAGPGRRKGSVMWGNPRDFSFLTALRQASDDGDFEPAYALAEERYREDILAENPNLALKQSWPSSCMFRTILFKVGQKLGNGALVYLDRIADADQRLFARIELAAALAGLPEWQETQRGFHPRPETRFVPRDPVPEEELTLRISRAVDFRARGGTIRCPKCRVMPGVEEWWLCVCGHRWNTFETGGICPSCRHRWRVTKCAHCHEVSPHADWYLEDVR